MDDVLKGFLTGVLISSAVSFITWRKLEKQNEKLERRILENGALDLIGHTPMIHLPRLSALLGCRILAKCEFMNPGGSSKDRIALSIIERAEKRGQLQLNPPSTIYEGTVGSTGIALTWIARLKGYACSIFMPDDQAKEKYALLEKLGATVEKCRPVPISNHAHFCRVAEERAQNDPHGLLANQFETMDNILAHYEHTGPEIYEQTAGDMDALVLGAGTGGTLAGCARYLKPRVPGLQVILADPQGSGLFNKVKHNVMYSAEESEGRRRRHQVDTVVEGVGINRMTRNLNVVLGPESACLDFENAINHAEMGGDLIMKSTGAVKWVDDAIKVTDEEAVGMARWMVQSEGLFLGSSSCINLAAVVKYCRSRVEKDRSLTIVTMLCDTGHRHLTKFWSDDYLKDANVNIINSKDERFCNLDFIK